uniref:Uncharacterized protein n=1 Tax=Plectus sambesii TaxID=2011161 RepID=A0A914XAR4_9BILA
CPDATWVYDSTTNRCFRAFAASPVTGVCNKDVPCVGLAAQYGVPSALAYTLNFQALVDAGLIGIANSIGTGVYYVGITDLVTRFEYVLDDGTPIPLASILPFFAPNNPNDTPANTRNYIITGNVKFDDNMCPSPSNYGSICQIQLTP